MESKEFIKWLQKNNLMSIARNHSVYFRNVLLDNLAIKNEDILIIGDYGSHGKRVAASLAGGFYLATKKLKLNTKIAIQHPKNRGEKSDEEVVDSLKALKNKSIILLNVSNKLGDLGALGKSFRRFCKANKHKFISITGVGDLETKDIYFVTRALNIDYNELRNECRKIKEKLDAARTIKIETDKGTKLVADITEQKAISIDGDYSGQNTGGNMPAGEVYIAPKKNSVNGTLIVDGSSRHKDGTIIIEKPIKMTIRDGIIINIEGSKEAELLKKTLNWAVGYGKSPTNTKRIGEIGIGLNPKINIIGAMVVDEKAKNTAHVGIGSNYWFGGDVYTFLHLDQVFRNPRIYLDGEELKI